MSVCSCVCVEQCEPWSGVSLLDWDLEVFQPVTFPVPEVGGCVWRPKVRDEGLKTVFTLSLKQGANYISSHSEPLKTKQGSECLNETFAGSKDTHLGV